MRNAKLLPWRPTVVGLGLAAVTLMQSVSIAGAGHGWIAPFYFSLFGLILYPIAVTRLWNFPETRNGANFAFILVALVLDALLVRMTLQEGVEYFHRVGVFAYVWVMLWSIWQALAVLITILRLKSPSL